MQKYSTIFFDLDDTLWDTTSNMLDCLEDIYKEFGICKYYETFANFFTVYKANNQKIWMQYSRHEISKETLDRERFIAPFRNFDDMGEKRALEINDFYLSNICHKHRTVEGAVELLEYLNPKYDLHIISNGFTELQFTKIESAGLSNFFDKIVLSDQVGVNKPHPDIYNYALNLTNTRKNEAMMIGDNLFADIEGAAKSGIDQIWYNPNEAAINDIRPTHIVRQLSEIKVIL